VFDKGISSLVSNNCPVSVLSDISEVFENTIHYQLSFYFTFKLHLFQHGFVRSESTVSSKGQVDSIYFNLIQVPHDLFLCKLNSFGLS
jgi:hypothetical protein